MFISVMVNTNYVWILLDHTLNYAQVQISIVFPDVLNLFLLERQKESDHCTVLRGCRINRLHLC